MRTIGDLLHEASLYPVGVSDLSWLGDRFAFSPPPWDLTQMITDFARRSSNLLDLGTGTGEWLSALPHRPTTCVATESWPANVTLATQRLAPLEVRVVTVEPVLENAFQLGSTVDNPALPFDDKSFHLICCRHESFIAAEVARLLDRGGRFITEQVSDGHYTMFHELMDHVPALQKPLTLDVVTAQLEGAGLRIKDSQLATTTITFADIGALAWYLRAKPWIIPGFTVSKYGARLSALHERISGTGPLSIPLDTFFVIAKRPKKH